MNEFSFSNRAFCFGCDEGREGKIIKTGRFLNHRIYLELVCEGCKKYLELIRPVTIPFVQVDSHEGVILWRIERGDFADNEDILGRFRETYALIDAKHQDDEKTIMLGASDEGSADELVYALIECYFRRKLGGK